MKKDNKNQPKSGKNQSSDIIKPRVMIETLSGRKRIYINGKLMQSYWDGPTEIPFKLIKDIEFKDLTGVTDICILYSKKDYKDPILSDYGNSEIHYEFVLDVVDEMTVNVFVTLFDNLEGVEHENYQLTLEEVVKENPDLTTYGAVHVGFDNMIEAEETLEELEKEGNTHIPYSAVGFMQFSVDLKGFVFKDIYKPLHKLITSLDEETRRRLKEEI